MKRKFNQIESPAFHTRSKIKKNNKNLHFSLPDSPLKQFVSATKVFNFVKGDTLVDWLSLYSNKNKKKDELSLFLCKSGISFETKIQNYLKQKFKTVTISNKITTETCKKTVEAMKAGIPLIFSAPVVSKNNTGGIVDLLIRSDYVQKIVNDVAAPNHNSPCIFSDSWHYVVIDVKFISLKLASDSTHLINTKNILSYKCQTLIYTNAVADIQKYKSRFAYLLGTGWKYTTKNKKYKSNFSFSKLGLIDFYKRDKKCITLTKNAIRWYRQLLYFGKNWSIDPPSRKELYPNMTVDSGYYFNSVKRKLAWKFGEVTSLWKCGIKNRNIAFQNGVFSWKDPKCNFKTLGLEKSKYKNVVQQILKINNSDFDVLPKNIKTNIFQWRNTQHNEVFVDFETINRFVDHSQFPNYISKPYIFMIGVGYAQNGTFIHKTFTARDISVAEEFRICKEFTKFMELRGNPKAFYWHAEKYLWKKNHNWKWADIRQIFIKEPVVIKNTFSYSIKDIAKSLRRLGKVTSCIESPCQNGMTAMLDAWDYYSNTISNKNKMINIQKYNLFDCKILYEIISYLRKFH